ncbi:MAG TPA: crosslink repair DNA glycosylase YcaQ family protein [Longimicrobiales bacterium]
MSAPAAPPGLSLAGARALAIAAQGLERRPRRRARKADVLACIRRMGALQIDTIHVVARSPYLVLWSRLGDYRPEWLEQLLEERKIFEYWAHEASFLPMEDYPLLRWRMNEPECQGWHYRGDFMRKHRAETEAVREHLRASGPLRSSDFEHPDGKKGGGWWGWKTEKRILEYLFTAGEVMIAARERFQRLYDLRERVLPRALQDAPAPSKEEAVRQLALRAVRALGVARAGWVADYYRTDKRSTPALVRQLAGEGALVTVQVEGWKEPGFVHPDNAALLERAADGALKPSHTTLLSPFDPIVWDRKRARDLFGFDYALECYIPGPKRRWGYYVLPILRRDALVGRLDAKAHRQKDGGGTFEVKSLWLEEGVRAGDRLAGDIAGALLACAAWHGTPEVALRRVHPERFGSVLEQALANASPPADAGVPPGDVARPDPGGRPAAAD